MKTFQNKVVIITGASSGIGEETAKQFYKQGAKLTLTGRNKSNLERVAQECGGALTILGDLSQDSVSKKIIDTTLSTYGQIDILINNAGVLDFGSIETTSVEQLDKVFNINVRSVYNLTIQAVPHLIKTKGNIVNISSICGLRAFSGVLSYCMSKSALDQFTRCVALELASKGVRVNAVNPGVIVTPLQQRSGMNDKEYKEYIEKSKLNHALGRPGNVNEVADAILFLASSKSSFITGETLSVDGGRHAMCPR